MDIFDLHNDPLDMRDWEGLPSNALWNLLAGRSVFLLCGGPSTREIPLQLLNRRGCWTFAVNNVAAGTPGFRPQAFTCSDPPKKFHDAIWKDPSIMKIIPTPKLTGGRGRSGLREKLDNGNFRKLKFDGGTMRVAHCPNVWGYQRRSWLEPDDTFFTEPEAAWGNHNAGVARTGQPKTVCTMLLAMRVLRYLGASKVFLLGVDFNMTPEQGYSFDQNREPGACASNNRQFSVVNKWLCQMQDDGVFERFGISFYNCNQQSGLRAFPYVSFDEAIEHVCAGVDPNPDVSGWYEK